MKKSDIKTVPAYYQKYIDQVPDIELMEALKSGGIELFHDHLDFLLALGDQVYAPGKWTVNQMVEHLMDTERIFLNRALRFARLDKTALPGFDENVYVANARSNELRLQDLLNQYSIIRQATVTTYSNFNEEELNRTGTADSKEISVLALGFIQVGHPIHHFNVVKERYFPLLK